ncbi:Helix-turn-helix domain (DUF4817) [Popillia japonica]|uniref:Helix-turn-helix domain (DUF4817) n=1 Tax=Popillia japonica TaxID=7064 RepID=A0AAW1N0P4_POPJA
MASYPTEVRVVLIKYYYRNGESFAATLFGRNNASTENTIKRIVVKFEATASAADERSTVRERQNTIRVPETIERVREHFTAQPSTSTSRASQELEIPRTTLRRILKQDLKMKPYKMQINQPLRPFDMERRFDFANEIIERIENGRIIGPVIVNGTVAHGLNIVENAWFMHDGARPHRTEEVFKILEEHFGNRIIGLDAQQFTGLKNISVTESLVLTLNSLQAEG